MDRAAETVSCPSEISTIISANRQICSSVRFNTTTIRCPPLSDSTVGRRTTDRISKDIFPLAISGLRRYPPRPARLHIPQRGRSRDQGDSLARLRLAGSPCAFPLSSPPTKSSSRKSRPASAAHRLRTNPSRPAAETHATRSRVLGDSRSRLSTMETHPSHC